MIATMAPIELTELQAKASLQTRIDRKYLVELDRLDDVLSALPSTTQVLQIESRRQFCYRSVYFDTADLLAYRLTALRRRRRFKIRTRSYLDSGQHLLEVKTRGPRGTTVKQQLAYDGDGEHLLGEDRLEACQAVAQTGATPPEATELRPVLITTYHRVTLFLPTSRSRVTIDTDLCWLLPDGSQQRRLRDHGSSRPSAPAAQPRWTARCGPTNTDPAPSPSSAPASRPCVPNCRRIAGAQYCTDI